MQTNEQTTELALADGGVNSPFDALKHFREDGSFYWSARDLMPRLGYKKWERFEDSVDRARAACRNSSHDEATNFVSAQKVISINKAMPPGTGKHRKVVEDREVADIQLSRFGAYLVAMNGDPRKAEVADAQAYFAIRTHEAETAHQPALPRTFKEALIALVAAEDEKERLALVALNAENAIQEAQPAIEFHRRVARAVNAQPVAQVGKVLKIGPRKIWEFLQAQRFVFKQGDNWVPMQNLINQELFTVVEKVRPDGNGQEHVYVQTLVTGKGIQWIRRKWDESLSGQGGLA